MFDHIIKINDKGANIKLYTNKSRKLTKPKFDIFNIKGII